MKEVISVFLFCLVVSCLLASFDPQQPPFPWPVGINGTRESEFGTRRDESAIGEVNYVDASRPSAFMTKIDAKSDERNVEFPLGAAN
jgi:hypothetical protein